MKLYIKNMVCNRCRMAVKALLEKLNLTPVQIDLGEVELAEEQLDDETIELLRKEIESLGFSLIDDRRSRIIEKIKTLIIELVHYRAEDKRLKHSGYIASHLHYDYAYLSRLFSEVEGITIEQYLILQKIERVKELLVYEEMNVSELAEELGYSSVAHLSAQFKKVTGMTPTTFRTLHRGNRTALDEIGK